MAEIIRLRKGLDIKLLGAPVKELTEVGLAESYALCPDDFTGHSQAGRQGTADRQGR